MVSHRWTAERYLPDDEERERLGQLGFVRIPMDLPWPIEPANITLVLGPRPALIDAGLRYMQNLELLEQALARVDLCVEDLAEIWLTHPHIDHFGLAGELVARSGAEVYAFGPSITRYHEYLDHWERDRAAGQEAFVQAGVPEQVLRQALSPKSQFDAMGGPVEIGQGFEDGQQVRVAGRPATILHVPGHSPWCSAFWFGQEQVLVSGDALLERITSNPIWYPPFVSPAPWQGLEAYRRSLRRLAQVPAACILPGHGRSFAQHPQVIERALRSQERRQAHILDVFAESTEAFITPFQVAQAIFGSGRAETSVFLVMSEILRHLDWLVAEGQIVCQKTLASWRYSMATSRAA